jgi:hypothetical protein
MFVLTKDDWGLIAVMTVISFIVNIIILNYVVSYDMNKYAKELSTPNTEIKVNYTNLLVYEVYGFNKNKEFISFKVAENRSLPYYNCQNFSRDTIHYLMENYNISSHLMWGCKYENYTQCHNWIAIDMEPQSGRLVNFDKEYPYRYNTTGEQEYE